MDIKQAEINMMLILRTQELVAMLKAEELTPSKPLPQEYASYLLSGDWKDPELKHLPDHILEVQPTGEEVRKQLAEILLAARKKKEEKEKEEKEEEGEEEKEEKKMVGGWTESKTLGEKL